MAKSEVLIEMPDFEKKYNLAMVESEKVSSRVRPKQFLHIDEAECILCEGCVDICPWKCIHYLSTDAIEDSINVEAPSMELYRLVSLQALWLMLLLVMVFMNLHGMKILEREVIATVIYMEDFNEKRKN